METKYNNGGFAPNKGVYDCLDDVTAHRARLWNSQLYKKLNTIKTESFICKDGPFEGQTLELSIEDQFMSAIFTVGKWHGRYVSGQWVSMNENEDVSSLQKIETKATAHNYGNMGKGYEKLGQFIDDIFCNESELPAFTKYQHTKKSIRVRSHCTDDFGNKIEDIADGHISHMALKTRPIIIKKDGKKRNAWVTELCEKIDVLSTDFVMVDDFGELFKPIGVFNQYEHEYYKPIAQFKTFTIGGQAFTIKADHESRENFIKKIVKAKKWFADKSLSKPVSLDSKIKQMQMEEIAIAATQGHIKPNDLNHFERVRMHQANKAFLMAQTTATIEPTPPVQIEPSTIEPTPPIQIATLNEFDFIVTKFGANQAYADALANRVPFSGIRSRFQYPIIQTEPEPPIYFEPVATEPAHISHGVPAPDKHLDPAKHDQRISTQSWYQDSPQTLKYRDIAAKYQSLKDLYYQKQTSIIETNVAYLNARNLYVCNDYADIDKYIADLSKAVDLFEESLNLPPTIHPIAESAPVATEPTPPVQIETATIEPTPPIQSETEIDTYITAKIAELKTKASKCRLHDRPAWAEKIDAVITQLQASLQPKPPTKNPPKQLASTCQRKARARIPWPKYICTTKIGFGHKMDAPMPASQNNAKNLVDYSP